MIEDAIVYFNELSQSNISKMFKWCKDTPFIIDKLI